MFLLGCALLSLVFPSLSFLLEANDWVIWFSTPLSAPKVSSGQGKFLTAPDFLIILNETTPGAPPGRNFGREMGETVADLRPISVYLKID